MKRVAGLFAGIGGFELAFERAGFEPALLAEIDPAASLVLRRRFPDAELAADVAALTDLPGGLDVLTAGFPCQNLSMAGDKSGIDGKKSSVVQEMFRLIERADVPTVLIENVYFMLQLDRGAAMLWLTRRFEELGYDWAYRVLDTIGFGLPQRRRRVYFVASKVLDPRAVLFADEGEPEAEPKPDLERPLGFYWTEGRSGIGLTVDAIPPVKVGSAVGIPSAPAVLFPDGAVLTPSISALERLQGFPPGWTQSAAAPTRDPRWRLVGNAVSVPVAAWVAGRIANPGLPLDLPTRDLAAEKSWPIAAFSVSGARRRVEVGERPAGIARATLNGYRDAEWKPLSERALRGFVSRVEAGGLWTPPGFVDRLKAAIGRAAARMRAEAEDERASPRRRVAAASGRS